MLFALQDRYNSNKTVTKSQMQYMEKMETQISVPLESLKML
jgi:hypothetical protein